jgi:hypothetical protein
MLGNSPARAIHAVFVLADAHHNPQARNIRLRDSEVPSYNNKRAPWQTAPLPHLVWQVGD